MFVRNCWYVAAWDHDITQDQLHAMVIINQPLVLYRSSAGEVIAMEDRCCHRFAPLSKGQVEDGCNIRCMYHGLKFAPDGQCIEIPGQDMIPATAKVRTYPVVVRDSWVWVWMGDVERADPSLIPPAVGLDDPRYAMRTGSIDYKANYQLINDNLTDFSHLSYVHANSFGASPYWAKIRPTVKPIERGIRVTRWVATDTGEVLSENAPTVKLRPKGAGPTAMYHTYDYCAPGIMVMRAEIYRKEDMPEDGVSPPTTGPVTATLTCQAVTPMTDGTSRYFFSWGPRMEDGGEEASDNMIKLAFQAFNEDREMIEAQQAIIDQVGYGREVLTSADVGPVQMRAVIRKLFRAENAQTASNEDESAGEVGDENDAILAS